MPSESTYHNLEELLELVAVRLSPEELLEVLEMSMWDLVEKLKDDIESRQEEVERAVR